ncbi:MAG: hypothetical protein AAF212_12635 [Verrucomicrobiota bacterium]
MKTASFQAVTNALNEAEVRYIVVGELAVIAHGYLRSTRNADIVLELIPENIQAAFAALNKIGFNPTLPITSEQFSNPELRRQWQKEKNMQVLQFWADTYPDLKLDVFIEHPFDFELEWQNSMEIHLGTKESEIRIASIPALISMKRVAGRPKDLVDIEYLEKIQNELKP